MADKSAVVVGVGASRGLGAAIARRFAREGFRVTVMGRSAEKLEAAAEGAARAGRDGRRRRRRRDRRGAGAARRRRGGRADAPLEAAIFNAGGNWPRGFLDMDAAFLEDMWRVNALAGFFFAKAALDAMLPRQRGVLLFTGASASLRGRAKFGGFAQAKAALRALAQSAAREFGPQGIHVAHVIVDGAIDGDRINTFLPSLKDAARRRRPARPRRDRRELLDALPAAAQRLDARARRAAVGGELVGSPWQPNEAWRSSPIATPRSSPRRSAPSRRSPTASTLLVGMAIGQPPALLEAIAARMRAGDLQTLRLYYKIAMEPLAKTLLADDLLPRVDAHTFFAGGRDHEIIRQQIASGRKLVSFVPCHFSQLPRVVTEVVKPDTFIVTVSPMDRSGHFSLGTNNDFASTAARCAGRLVVEVNRNMPRVFGQSQLHLDEVDAIVENHVPLLTHRAGSAERGRPRDRRAGRADGAERRDDPARHRQGAVGGRAGARAARGPRPPHGALLAGDGAADPQRRRERQAQDAAPAQARLHRRARRRRRCTRSWTTTRRWRATRRTTSTTSA